VNGKALVAGLQLVDMPASDMLDVIHFFFEQDMDVTTAEQQEAKSQTRTSLYQDMYGRTYKYGYKKKNSNSSGSVNPDDYETEDGPDMADIKPFETKKAPTKAYVPVADFDPTAQNPFGNGLDGPMR
jgi:hypothetical protein